MTCMLYNYMYKDLTYYCSSVGYQYQRGKGLSCLPWLACVFYVFSGLYVLVTSSALAVRANTVSGLEVLVSEKAQGDFLTDSLITDKKWALLRQSFRQVDMDKMTGRNFTHKMELLLSVYSGKVKP